MSSCFEHAADIIQASEQRFSSILDPILPKNAAFVRKYGCNTKVEYLVAMLLIERGHGIEWVKNYLQRNHNVIIDHSFLAIYGFKNGKGKGNVKDRIVREVARLHSMDFEI